MSKRQSLVLAVGAVLALATGCSGGGDDTGKIASISSAPKSGEPQAANATGTEEDQMRAFAKCMRDHGVDMADPEMSPDGKGSRITVKGAQGVAPGSGPDTGALDTANEACKSLLPNGGEMKPMNPEELDKARADAKCMRDHGVDMPDPDPAGGGRTMRIGGSDVDKDKMEAAMKACGMGMAMPAEPAK
jgi:hypothetical protein